MATKKTTTKKAPKPTAKKANAKKAEKPVAQEAQPDRRRSEALGRAPRSR